MLIGIPTLNNPIGLTRLLDSIKTSYEYDIHVIDNGRNLPQQTIDVTTPKRNLGVAPSWNYLINLALVGHYSYILLLNDDIILEEYCIDNMVESLIEHSMLAISGVQTKSFDDTYAQPRYMRGMHFSCFMLTPRCIESVGFFDEMYAPAYTEDTDYYYRLERLNKNYGCDRWARFLHFKNKKARGIKHSLAKNRAYFTKKWGISPKVVFNRMVEGRTL